MGRLRNLEQQIPHRPGPLVQNNKKHKCGKHRTKGEIDNNNRGRISSISSGGKRSKKQVKRSERRKQATADRIKKIKEVVEKKRSQGGRRGAPISIGIIPLSFTSNLDLIQNHILSNFKSFGTILGSTSNSTHLKLSNGKLFTLVKPPSNDIWAVLDVLKLSDVALFLLPTLEPLSEAAQTLLQCSKDQGSPTKFLGVSSDFTKSEEKLFLKSIQKTLKIERIYPIVNPGQISNLFRMIGVTKIQTPKSYNIRSGIIIENADVLHLNSIELQSLLPINQTTLDLTHSTLLRVCGTVRKRNLNPHRPVHIPGNGSYQILRIDVTPIIQDLNSIKQKTEPNIQISSLKVETLPRFLFNPVECTTIDDGGMEDEAMSMDSDDLNDEFESQGTINSDDEEIEMGRKLVPKGTSNYQADWLLDSDSEKEKELLSDDEELESLNGIDGKGEDDEEEDDMDWDEEKKQLELNKAARTEAEFPDWIDTPMDVNAKERFQRYRGLQSFKTSPWDINENLPKEYSKISQFQNYRHTFKESVVKDPEDGPMFIPVGQRITLILKPLEPTPLGLIGIGQSKPLALFSLFNHETKMSVINLQLNLSNLIKNKETLIFQVGFQRFQAKPILSEVSPGNKHKMLRYGQINSSCMATIYGPIIFPLASVLVFKSTESSSSSSVVHVGSGSLFSIDPSRLVIKRILLSGYPFSIHGRKSTVRFMFFNRDDIEWFKPVELKTRYGRRGHIKEPLGTHGHMKCVFDGAIKSQDTILMPLYKRIFPKLTYEPFVPPYTLYDTY